MESKNPFLNLKVYQHAANDHSSGYWLQRHHDGFWNYKQKFYTVVVISCDFRLALGAFNEVTTRCY
jgi:hypothetical protein